MFQHFWQIWRLIVGLVLLILLEAHRLFSLKSTMSYVGCRRSWQMVSMRRLCCVKIMDIFGSHNSVSTAKDLCLAYTRNSRLVFCYWRWLAEKINLSWGTHLRPRRNHWSLRSQRSHDWLLFWQKCCFWKFTSAQVLSSWNMFNFMPFSVTVCSYDGHFLNDRGPWLLSPCQTGPKMHNVLNWSQKAQCGFTDLGISVLIISLQSWNSIPAEA